MPGMHEGILLLTGFVATEAALRVFFGIRAEGKDQLIGRESLGLIATCGFLPFHVCLARTVARLATHHDLSGRFQSRMRGLVELRYFRTMARAASVVTDKIVGRRRGCRRSPRDRRAVSWSRDSLRQSNAPAGDNTTDWNQDNPATVSSKHQRHPLHLNSQMRISPRYYLLVFRLVRVDGGISNTGQIPAASRRVLSAVLPIRTLSTRLFP